MAEPLLFDVVDGVGHIVLNRPESANAMDLALARRLSQAIDACERDEVRAVLVTGAGSRFCVGGDVPSFMAAEHPAAHIAELAATMEASIRRLGDLPKPLVSGVHGAVAGAGLAFPLSSDVVVAARGTKLTMAYANIGLTPDCGVSYLLPRVVGLRRALDFTMRREVVDADTALAWGLVTEVVEPVDVPDRAMAVARELAGEHARALGQARRLLRAASELPRVAHAKDEVRTIAASISTPEAQRMIHAFLDRTTAPDRTAPGRASESS